MTPRAILREPGADRWLRYADPHRIFQTARVDQVGACLREIEAEVETSGLEAVGFVAYEAAPAFDRALLVRETKNEPLVWFGLFGPPQSIDDLAALQTHANAPAVMSSAPLHNATLLPWLPTIDQAEYEANVAAIRDAIACGDTYQVNYTFRLRQDLAYQQDLSHYAAGLFARWAQAQPSPYAALIESDDFAICSASPELFFQLDGRTIVTRPMKGTAPRGLTFADDLAAARKLAASEKNRAENAMIVDMMRNDLGRIADVGSVQVDELFHVARYPTLWQMTSRIVGKTSASLDEIFAALFPCASVTGAPKASTMGIIARRETAPRGVYTGAIGRISPHRQMQFNVAIRTAAIDKRLRTAEYGIGGGVVWDSTPRGEYCECLLKAAILTSETPEFSLLESLLHTPETGYFLFERHLRRMAESAEYFGFAPPTAAAERLKHFAHGLSPSPHFVRLTLSRGGEYRCESRPLTMDELAEPVHLELASEPIDANDVFLYHKTTHREMYAKARAGCQTDHDVLLYNSRGEVTETNRANIVVQIDGRLYTPPVASGLLAGTLRQQMIDDGEICERVITLEMVAGCDRLMTINSVRRCLQAKLVGLRDPKSLFAELQAKAR